MFQEKEGRCVDSKYDVSFFGKLFFGANLRAFSVSIRKANFSGSNDTLLIVNLIVCCQHVIILQYFRILSVHEKKAFSNMFETIAALIHSHLIGNFRNARMKVQSRVTRMNMWIL